MNGGDRVAEVLAARGVRFLFTLCGGHISPILVGAKQRGIRVVDVRDEATAVFAADAVARLDGVPGVAAVTAGPGVTNTLTAVTNAQLAQSPVLILGGATATILKGRGALQDIDQEARVRPHVKSVARAKRVRELQPLVAQALDAAREGVPGPVFVECPVDLLYDAETVRQWYGLSSGGQAGGVMDRLRGFYLRRHVEQLFADADAATPVPASAPPLPPASEERAIARTAVRLAKAERPLLLVGSGALLDPGRALALARAVETLGVPVYLSGMARGLLGREHPLQLRHARKLALREADLVILAGTPCDFRLDYGRHISRSAALVSVSRARSAVYLNRRPAIGAVAAPESFLSGLAALLGAGRGPAVASWLGALRERDLAREREIEAQAAQPLAGVNPLALCRAIERALPEDGIVVADGGDFVATASYVLRPRRPLSWLDPGVFGTLGVGAGFAIGAQLARPRQEVWALFGDGAFGYGLAEIDSFVRHGLPVISVIGNDAGWTQIAREQVDLLKDDVGTVLRASDYERAAEGLGASGLRIERDEQADEVLARAREIAASGRPVVINALIGRSQFRKGSISI
jgi:thiamine pyrophosphate-dependent acetolactate synthase large subunit-like protein